MIGQIGADQDIVVYLTFEEVKKLENQTLEGVLIKHPKIKQQGTVLISVNEKRSNENGFGIGVIDTGYGFDSVGRFELFMAKAYYEKLRTQGSVGLRYGTNGSKVDVSDLSKLDWSDKDLAERLEFYRDNRGILPDS